MKENKFLRFIALSLLLVSCASYAAFTLKPNLDVEWVFSGMYKPEMFYGRNISLLNNNVAADRIWFARHTMDLNFNGIYGKKTYDCEVAEFLFTMRNKGVWGNPNSVSSTTDSQIKGVTTLIGKHKHFIPRHFFWIRELWLKFNLGRAAGLTFDNQHSLTLGSFSFEVGRGIALGDAYAVGPEFLGFYTDAAIDQYAFGGKLSGDILKDILTYDFYMGILQNKSSSLGDTGEEIYNQAIGREEDPRRGYGHINYVVAAKLDWYAFDNDLGKLMFEPYGLYASDPEQRVQFTADANSKLGTIGLACEYEGDRWALGFDTAQNFGRQSVLGWDRNQVVQANVEGHLVEAYSNIRQSGPTSKDKVLFTPSTRNIVEASREDEVLGLTDKEPQNGKFIGNATINGVSVPLYNDKVRYRDSYVNKYQGWMFVTDAAVWAYKKDLQFAVTAGVASGDDNPNEETIDLTYDGFISLQEFYSGKRVKSAFLMGSAGKLKRPLSTPTDEQAPNQFANVISGFSNLVFCGVGMNWKPQDVCKKFNVNPNVIAFWQQKPTKAFDLSTLTDSTRDARTYLGTEANIFFNYHVLKDLRYFMVVSGFFPGTHYADIRGKPLSRDQLEALEDLDVTGVDKAAIPNLATDVAYTFNMGLEFKF